MPEQLPAIERNIDIAAEPDEVWERVADGDLAEESMGVRVDPRRGGAVTVPDRDIIGTVEEVAPGESITWSWREIDGEPSQVTIEIAPIESGSRVTIIERLLEYTITNLPPVFLDKVA